MQGSDKKLAPRFNALAGTFGEILCKGSFWDDRSRLPGPEPRPLNFQERNISRIVQGFLEAMPSNVCIHGGHKPVTILCMLLAKGVLGQWFAATTSQQQFVDVW